jgi:peptidyl-prolyl cis-trans isomerase SurA
MNAMKSITVLLLSSVIVTVTPFHCRAAEIFNRIVAVVNDDVVTLYELNQEILRNTGSTSDALEAQDDEGYIELRRNILDMMVNERCAQEKVKELEIEVGEEEVDAHIERVKKEKHWTQEDLLATLSANAITYDEYREEVKRGLERDRLIGAEIMSRIIIREEEIRRYYEEHQADFATEETVHLVGMLMTSKNLEEAQDVLTRLKNGEGLAMLTDLGTFETNQLDPELKKVVDALNVGEVSELIVRPNGLQIIKLLEKQDKGTKTLEEVKEVIRSTLYEQEINKRYTAWIEDLRKEAYTRIIF